MADAPFSPDMDAYFRSQQRLFEQQMRKNMGTFTRGVNDLTNTMKVLQGNTQAASAGFSQLVKALGLGAFSTAITAAINGLQDMARTYNRLTDVGADFSGSMLQMERQAGAAGESLEEMGRQIVKNSTVISQLSADQLQGVDTFNRFQHGVRDNLKQFGYYGMTLSQVNDASGDYLETLRESGQLERMDADQLKDAGSSYIKNINEMSAATGKSREELMKLTNQALRSPATAARLAMMGPEQTRAFQSYATQMAGSMGEAGGQLTNMLSETFAAQGQTWATELGQVNIKSGMSQLNTEFEEMARRAAAGIPAEEQDFERIARMRDEIGAHMSSLQTLWLDPKNRAGVDQLFKFFRDTQGYKPDVAWKRAQDRAARHMDGVTQAVQMFETNFHDITGKFREGVFQSILSLVPGASDKEKLEAFQKGIERAKDLMFEFGKSVGVVIGLFADIIPVLEKFFEFMTWSLKGIESLFERFFGLPIFHLGPGLAKQLASTVTVIGSIAAVLGAKRWAKRRRERMLEIEARQVFINGRALGGGGGGGWQGSREQHDLGGGGGGGGRRRRTGGGPGEQFELDFGDTKEPAKRGFSKWFGRGSMGRRIAGGIGGMIVGGIASSFANDLLDTVMPEDTTTKKVIEDGLDIAMMAGGTFLPQIGKAILGPIARRLGWGIATEAAEAAATPAMAALAEGGAVAGLATIALPATLVAGAVAALGAVWYVDKKKKEELYAKAKELGYTLKSDHWWQDPEFRNDAGDRISFTDMQKKVAGEPTAAPTPATPPPDDQLAVALMQKQLGQTAQMFAPDPNNPLALSNADDALKKLIALTPANMNEAMKRMSGDAGVNYVPAQIKDSDSFKTLTDHLVDLEALKALDEEKIRRGEDTAKAQEQLAKIMTDMKDTIAGILLRSDDKREDLATRAANQAHFNALMQK